MKRDHCALCGNDAPIPILDLGESPLANDFPTEPGPQPTYPLRLLICDGCSLVQLEHVVPDEQLYGGDYAFYSSTSPALVAYHRAYAQFVRDRYSDLDRGLVVEVGCNDGSLLERLGFARQTLGVDPANGPVQLARERDLSVLNQPFHATTADEILDNYGAADLIIANNVAAHIADLHGFMEGLVTLMAPTGRALIEVQYLPDLLLGNMIDHVYHEHRYYWSLTALAAAARWYDLTITAAWQTEPQGGSIRVELVHRKTLWQSDTSVSWLLEREQGWATHPGAFTFASWQGRADRLRDRLLDLIHAHAPLVGIGAPAKSTTLLSYCDIGPDLLAHVEDSAPSKIGRYMPGGQIPVLAPSKIGLTEPVYLLLAWNYLRPILQREAAWRANGGKLIVPIPLPVLL